MGRKPPFRSEEPRSLVPWWLFHSDINPANKGKLEFTRDLVVRGIPEKHVAMFVTGQFVASLGMIAIRCERRQTSAGEQLLPMGMAIPDDAPMPIDTAENEQSGSNRSTRQLPDDNGANEEGD